MNTHAMSEYGIDAGPRPSTTPAGAQPNGEYADSSPLGAPRLPLARCGRVMHVADWDGVTFHYVCVLHADHEGRCRGRWVEQAS